MFQSKDLSFIHRYFIAEKQESLLFLIVGVLAILIGGSFLLLKYNSLFFKGAAIPLIAVGIIQSIVGYNVYSRSDKQKMEVAYNAGMDPHYVTNMELPRMEKVMKNFTFYRYTEIILAVAGIGMFVYFRADPDNYFWKGIGATLAIQAILMLGADGFAERRGGNYRDQLKTFLIG